MVRFTWTMTFGLLWFLGMAHARENTQQYRMLVIAGSPSVASKALKAQRIYVDRIVELHQTIAIGTLKSDCQMNGVLTKTEAGLLHFKGHVRVYSTGAEFDMDTRPGEALVPEWMAISGIGHLFFLKIEPVEAARKTKIHRTNQ